MQRPKQIVQCCSVFSTELQHRILHGRCVIWLLLFSLSVVPPWCSFRVKLKGNSFLIIVTILVNLFTLLRYSFKHLLYRCCQFRWGFHLNPSPGIPSVWTLSLRKPVIHGFNPKGIKMSPPRRYPSWYSVFWVSFYVCFEKSLISFFFFYFQEESKK